MAQIINTNVASLNAQRNLNTSQTSLHTALQRLSSGLRVNSAKDDAAGLAIATRMDSIIRGSQTAVRNTNDGISMAQTVEDAIGKIGDSFQRMRELAVQASNGSLASGDRANLQTEFAQMQAEIARVASGASFNGIALLDSANGLSKNDATFQVGANNKVSDQLTVSGLSLAGISNYTGASGAVVGATFDISCASDAQAALDHIDSGLSQVTTARAKWGSVQNRFDAIVSSLQVFVENQSAAKSRIMDADFASETANLTRGQILQQAGTAMLAQANSLPNGVLSLLR